MHGLAASTPSQIGKKRTKPEPRCLVIVEDFTVEFGLLPPQIWFPSASEQTDLRCGPRPPSVLMRFSLQNQAPAGNRTLRVCAPLTVLCKSLVSQFLCALGSDPCFFYLVAALKLWHGSEVLCSRKINS